MVQQDICTGNSAIFLYCTVNCVYSYLVNIPEPVQYMIYVLAVPFDLRCESGTSKINFIRGTICAREELVRLVRLELEQ